MYIHICVYTPQWASVRCPAGSRRAESSRPSGEEAEILGCSGQYAGGSMVCKTAGSRWKKMLATGNEARVQCLLCSLVVSFTRLDSEASEG
jgi:hypothetical protein